MRPFLTAIIGVLLTTVAYGEDEIAFEEQPQEECQEEYYDYYYQEDYYCPHCHCRYYWRSPEEEKLYQERTETYWPGKREGLLEELTHY